MTLVADLHLHSRYSRATSRDLTPETLHLWSQKKGVHILATGDCTHPQWLTELQEKLEPAEDGLWRLRPHLAEKVDTLVPPSCRSPVRFLFQTEISTIYKKDGRTRKVHHLIILPGPTDVQRLSARLGRVGNLKSDGRPILGMDSRDLLETVLEACEDAIFIPAHIWTPWFSVFGSKSGFDALEECYGDLTPHIAALETGLSSDPAMNWRWSMLDDFRLVSNSDAHSPSRIGREANLLDIPLSYGALRDALLTGEGLVGTVEFFPEEGKYHLDGHRKCGISMDPSETIARDGCCPACGQAVTVGVLHRVEALGDRISRINPPCAKPFLRLLPLDEILGEVLGCGPTARRVQDLQQKLLERWGPELRILRETPLSTIEEAGVPLLAEAFRRTREERVFVEAGYDGQYGKVRLFRKEERSSLQGQGSLLPNDKPAHGVQVYGSRREQLLLPSSFMRKEIGPLSHVSPHEPKKIDIPGYLNPRQREAVLHDAPFLMIVAGPGTGKTLTLTHRIAHYIRTGKAHPRQILAVTFTQRASTEMKERLGSLLGESRTAEQIKVQTLHAFGYWFLREHQHDIEWERFPFVIDERSRMHLLVETLKQECPALKTSSLPSLMAQISLWKQTPHDIEQFPSLVTEVSEAYDARLRKEGAIDFDDLIRYPVQILAAREDLRAGVRDRTRFVFVDEYQDLNALQVRLIRMLCSGDSHHLTAIGDPDQSIYGFRGAEVGHFMEFERSFTDAQVVRLEENYRSTGTVVRAAMEVISQNHSPLGRSLTPLRETGDAIRCFRFDTERAEAIFVAQEIGALLGGISHWTMHRDGLRESDETLRLTFKDVGILYRLHALGDSIEETLSREGVPYQRFDNRPLRGQETFEALLCGLRWLVDASRDEDLLQAIAYPSMGVSRNTVGAIRECMDLNSGALWKSLENPERLPIPLDRSEIKRLQRHMRSLISLAQGVRVASVHHVISRLTDLLRIRAGKSSSTWQPAEDLLRRFLATSEHWSGDLLSFLDFWSIQEEGDLYDPRSERVAMMSVHSAKGLEFPVVFLIGCDEGLFPHLKKDAAHDLEEERRLFFVAMTRARELLYITSARSRNLWGQRLRCDTSRFLAELPRQHLVEEQDGWKPRTKRPAKQLKLFSFF